jgi:hypothetical protein
MDSSSSAVTLEGVAAESFAGLIDYLRNYRDCAGLLGEHPRRETKLVGQNWTDKTPREVTIAYLVVVPKGSGPSLIFAPRQVKL